MAVRWVQRKSEEVLQTQVDFSDLQIQMSTSSLTLRNVHIHHPDRKNEMIGEIPEITFHLESFSELFRKEKPIEVTLKHPKIIFTTLRSGDWELSDRFPLMRRDSGQKRLSPFNVDKVSVQDGELEFHDGRMGTVIQLHKVQFSADHFQLPTAGNPLPITFDAQFNVGNAGSIVMKGQGDFLSPKTSFKATLKAQGLALPPYAAYYEAGLPVHVRSGTAYFETEVVCDQEKLHVPIHASVSGLKVDLKDHKTFEFVADDKVESMKNSKGMIETDLVVTGDLTRPKISFLTKFDASFSTGMKAVGHKIKSGFGKVKDFFTGK